MLIGSCAFSAVPSAVLGDLAGPGWHGLDLVRAAHTLLPAEQGCFNGTLAWHDGHGALSSARHVPVEPRAVCAAVLVAEQSRKWRLHARLVCWLCCHCTGLPIHRLDEM